MRQKWCSLLVLAISFSSTLEGMAPSALAARKEAELEAPEMAETSVNLDLSDLEPILLKVSEKIDSDFDETAAQELAELAQQLPVGNSNTETIEAKSRGIAGELTIEVVKEDVDVVDVYFASSVPGLILTVDRTIRKHLKMAP